MEARILLLCTRTGPSYAVIDVSVFIALFSQTSLATNLPYLPINILCSNMEEPDCRHGKKLTSISVSSATAVFGKQSRINSLYRLDPERMTTKPTTYRKEQAYLGGMLNDGHSDKFQEL